MNSNLQKSAIIFLLTVLFATVEINAQLDIPDPPDKDEDRAAATGVLALNSGTKEIIVLNQQQQVVTIIKTEIGLVDPSILSALPKGIYFLRTENQRDEYRILNNE